MYNVSDIQYYEHILHMRTLVKLVRFNCRQKQLPAAYNNDFEKKILLSHQKHKRASFLLVELSN